MNIITSDEKSVAPGAVIINVVVVVVAANVIAGSSPITTQDGAVEYAVANVNVHVSDAEVPIVTFPPASVAVAETLGEVPQDEADGAVPAE